MAIFPLYCCCLSCSVLFSKQRHMWNTDLLHISIHAYCLVLAKASETRNKNTKETYISVILKVLSLHSLSPIGTKKGRKCE